MHRARGFSLLEILVAFTLLAVAMAILMQVFSRGVNNADLADRYARANMLAESMLESIGTEIALAEGETSGEFQDGYTWRASVKLYSTTGEEPATLLETPGVAGAANVAAPPAPPVAPSLGQPTSIAAANSAAATARTVAANSNVDVETLLPVRVYEIDLAIAFKSDDGRERIVALNTLKLGPKPQ